MKVALLLLLTIIGICLGADLQECQDNLEAFKTRLATYSHYVPPPPQPTKGKGMDADMGGGGMGDDMDDDMGDDMDGMDDMDGGMMDDGGDEMGYYDDMDMKKKKRTDPPTDCFSVDPATNMLYINCKSYQCIDILANMIQEYETSFVEECPMAPGFTVDDATKQLMESLRRFPGCNRCLVSYNSFAKLKADITNQGCWSTETSFSCTGNCLALNSQYKNQYDYMVREKVCRKSSMGYKRDDCVDCELTEGQIYQILKNMHEDITRIVTVQAMCLAECPAPVAQWYEGWKSTAQGGCLETEGIDLNTQDPTLKAFKVKTQCDHDCRDEIQELITKSFSLPNSCKTGFLSDHLSGLVNAVNPKFCGETVESGNDDDGLANFFQDMTPARLAIFVVIGIVCGAILILGSVILCNYIKGRRGWELLLIRSRSSAANYKNVDNNSLNNSSSSSEEEMVKI